jgi:hypothetical protein
VELVGPKLVGYLEWWYQDIQDFVKEVWGIEWKGGAAMGFPAQNTYVDIEATGGWFGVGIDSEEVEREALWIDEAHDRDQAYALIEKVKKEGMPREEYADPGLELVLNLLVNEDRIPAGKYRVTVHW